MKILLVYPEYPDTFWSFKHALRFVSKKALLPPLGLITIAPLLPENFEKKLIDMNVSKLTDKDILWADFVFISAMITQKDSTNKVIERCNKLGAKTVAGGPLFTGLPNEFPNVDHLILNEGEITLPMFLEDLQNGQLKRIYKSDTKPDIKKTPIPQWELLNLKAYSKMPIQTSRGCPFDCEFCDIVNLNGRVPRTKEPAQVINEIDALYDYGWKSSIFIVDDNFIGNKEKAKELLRAIIEWKKTRTYKNTFMTEVSLNLADDEELLELMRDAGFDTVFIGLETPSKESLNECGKFQNKNRDLIGSVKKIQQYGMEVSAGFIVGFDSDDETIFDRQIEFIQKTGVVVAMVGLLQALPGTKLFNRLKKENRLIENSSGNNTDFSTNFIPKMDPEVLMNGYKKIIDSIYSPQYYFDRLLTFLKHYEASNQEPIDLKYLSAFFKSIILLGILDNSRKFYWKILFTTLIKYRQSFSKAITMTVYYAHFRKIFEDLAEQTPKFAELKIPR